MAEQLDLMGDALPPRALAAINARLDARGADERLRRVYTTHWRDKYLKYLGNLRFGEPAAGAVRRRLEQLRHWRRLNGPEGVSVGIAVIEAAMEVTGVTETNGESDE